MTDLTEALIKDKMRMNNLSMRKAAAEIGVSHTTVIRILEGEPYDIPTAEKIAVWLGVPLSTLLDLRTPGEDNLAKQIAFVLRQEPALAKVFGEAMSRLATGRLSVATIRALVSYAAFQLETNRPEQELVNGGYEIEE